MSESKTNVIYVEKNDSSAQEYSESNVDNEMIVYDVNEPKSDTNQNIKLSEDGEIGEINADKYFDDTYDKKVLYEEDVADQNVESRSFNNGINDVKNEENVDATFLITRDVLSTQPTVATKSHADTNESKHGHRHKYRPKFVYNRKRTLKEPAKRTAKIDGTGMKRQNKKPLKDHTTYYPCGHIKKMGATLLKHIGIKTPNILKDSCSLDLRVMKTHRYILKLPAALNVKQIINDYQRKTNACPEITDILITTFDLALPAWCLHFIERLQYDELRRRLPGYKMSELYGLAHLIRLIGFLPRLLNKLGTGNVLFNKELAIFMNGFMDYLVEENLRVDFYKDYYLILPEYLRMTRYALRNARRGLSQ